MQCQRVLFIVFLMQEELYASGETGGLTLLIA